MQSVPSPTPQVGEKIARGSLLLIMSGVLIVAAIATLGITFYFKNRQAPLPTVESRTIISVDNVQGVILPSISAGSVAGAIQNILKEKNVGVALTEIALKKQAVVGTSEVQTEELFKAIAKSAPSALARALGEKWLLGFHSFATAATSANSPFVIVELESFDNTFQAMLGWEGKMLADISPIFIVAENFSTPPVPRDRFEDLIVKSRDTRVLKDTDGNILILYSFIENDYLVITTTEEAFREIVNRYLAKGLVR